MARVGSVCRRSAGRDIDDRALAADRADRDSVGSPGKRSTANGDAVGRRHRCALADRRGIGDIGQRAVTKGRCARRAIGLRPVADRSVAIGRLCRRTNRDRSGRYRPGANGDGICASASRRAVADCDRASARSR